MFHFRLIRWIAPIVVLTHATTGLAVDDVGPLVRSLWLVQKYGTADSANPRNDQKVKGVLAKALGKENILTASGVQTLMEPSTFERLAGADGKLDVSEVKMALEAEVPESRKRLNPRIEAHLEWLSTSIDMIDGPHQEAGQDLAEWIVKNYRPGQPLQVSVICTGNSRRSILGATMGNVAAAYYGMPEVRFHSGGTAPSAFNPRTITALKAIGVEVEPTGSEAARGDLKTANPIYKVRWGPSGEPSMESTEFSKTFYDASNPQKGFAALMVCGEADEACPLVKGASTRISMPYLDPKIYDGSAFEAAKYAERRDDIGRLMLAVMMQARNQLGQVQTTR